LRKNSKSIINNSEGGVVVAVLVAKAEAEPPLTKRQPIVNKDGSLDKKT